MDNSSDNKSRRFFSFIAYLISKNVFQKIKVRYLVVGRTHEDIYGYFSFISRYFKKTLQQVLTISAFVHGLFSCSTCSKTAPKCVEQIQYCYDCSVIEEHVDIHIARFNLKEEIGDKCHYFCLEGQCKRSYNAVQNIPVQWGFVPMQVHAKLSIRIPVLEWVKSSRQLQRRHFLTHEKFWRTKNNFEMKMALNLNSHFRLLQMKVQCK